MVNHMEILEQQLHFMEDLFNYMRTNKDDNYADMTQFMIGTTNEYINLLNEI